MIELGERQQAADSRTSDMRVLLVEVDDSHDEVLLSWYRDLRHLGTQVFVTCPSHMWKRLAIADADGWLEASGRGSLFKRLKMMWKVRRYVLKQRITHIVLNTASGTTLRDLSMLLPKRCTIIGVLHDSSKLDGSFNQSVTTRNVDAYAVLAPYLCDIIPPNFKKPVVVIPATARDPRIVESHSQRMSGSTSTTTSASGEPLRVVIAGGINWKRRDYDSLFSTEGFARIGTNVRFVLAGGADPQDQERLRRMLDAAPRSMIEVHDGYIPHDVYANLINDADVVLPLVHPSCDDYHRYVRSRISGAMSSAWAYSKPLMLERGFQKHTSLSGAIFYDVDMLPDMLRAYADDRMLLAAHAHQPVFASDVVRRSTIRTLLA